MSENENELSAPFDVDLNLWLNGVAWGDVIGNIEDQSDLINLVNDTKGEIEQDISDLADTVSANYNELSGNISDLSDTVTSNYNDLSGQISDLSDTVSANYTDLDDKITAAKGDLSDHIADKSNPHEVTATQVGLGNCDNTSDLNKPISTATQTALDGKVDKLVNKPTANTYTKVTITDEGLVSSGDTLSASDIPSLTLEKISDVTASAEEVNILDGATVSTAELNVLDGITADTSELNILDGATLTTTELNYVNGVTSSIQTQLNGKEPTITGAATSVVSSDLTASRVIVSDSNGKISVSDITTTELNCLDNVTSNIQTQINGKQATISSDNMLSSDLVDDTDHTHKFATASQLAQITTNANDIITINGKIPSAATTTNQLADKDFVNSSIATNTANFIGTFNSVSDLEAYTGTVTNNDYSFVINGVITDNGNDWATFNDLNAYDKTLLTNFDYAWVINGANFDLYRFDIIEQTWDLRVSNTQKASVTLNTAYNRYKATVTNNVVSWGFEYTLNNSSFTSVQWAAINSGANSVNIAQISTNTNDIAGINSIIGGYGDIVTYNASSFATSAQGAKADSAVQTVTTGSTNGTIAVDGTDISVYGLGSAAYTSSSNYATSIQGGKADSAIQTVKVNGSALTPDSSKAVDVTVPAQVQANWNETNTSSKAYIQNKPTIPTVNNATLTIQKNSTTVNTFTANASTDVTCNISVPTDTGDLTNNAGYITNSAITNMQTTTNLVTSVSSASTDTQYPSAKLFYDTVGNLETLLHTINSGSN